MASIQSLGLGSGVLKQDQIDKLKKVDTKALLGPIERDITKAKTKNTDLSSLVVSASSAKSAQNPLSEELSYSKAKVSQEGTSVDVAIKDGVSPRSMSFVVKNLAQKEIVESNRFTKKDEIITVDSTELRFYVNSNKYTIPIIGRSQATEENPATTYSDLTSLIAEKSRGNIIASILNVGGDAPYKMILQTKHEGLSNQIVMGPIIKGKKNVDIPALKDILFLENDLIINDVDILNGKTRASIQSDSIPLLTPVVLKSKDLFINNIDIFNTTDAAKFEGEKTTKIDATVKSGDLKLNGIDIFTEASTPETQSSIDIDNINFPLNLKTNSLFINNVDIVDQVATTTIVSGTLNNRLITDDYEANNLVINGVSIFGNDGGTTSITSTNQLIRSINQHSVTTNIKASLKKIDSNNSRIVLQSLVPGDNIDIYTNNVIKFSKLRLSQGSTKGQDTQKILNISNLLSVINAKTKKTNVEATIRDNKLTLSSKNASPLVLSSLYDSSLSSIGLKEGKYKNPVGFKISSINDLAYNINKKQSKTHIRASVNDSKLILTNQDKKIPLDILGTSSILEMFGLKISSIQPLKQKTISNIQDIIDSINANTQETKVKAVKKNNTVVLEAIKDNVDINIDGEDEKLALIGFKKEFDRFKQGQVISSTQQLERLINQNTDKTNVKAIILDKKILLYNPLNSTIDIDGVEEKLSYLGLSTDMSHRSSSLLADIALHNKLGFTSKEHLVQKASNAKFEFNGIELERESNVLTDDLIVGMTVKLKHTDLETSKTRVNIALDTSLISESVTNFVTSYNSFMRKVEDLTKFKYDEAKGLKSSLVGSFQGVPNVVNIPYKFNSLLTTLNPYQKDIQSMKDVGVTFASKSNTLEINEGDLKKAIEGNFEQVKNLFLGHTYIEDTGKENKFEGIFVKINTEFNNLTKGDKSIFKLLENEISTDTSRLEANLTKNTKFLDDKYEAMKKDFIANDIAISKINNNFNSLKQQIDLDTARK